MSVQRWTLKHHTSSEVPYTFPRNPDREGGDSYWSRQIRLNEVDLVGSSIPIIQVDGFRGARRSLKFTAIPGSMMRKLQDFYLSSSLLDGTDHLFGTSQDNTTFVCFIESFTPNLHPTIGNFPGSLEDTWDVSISLIKME